MASGSSGPHAQTCCGRQFTSRGAYQRHRLTCSATRDKVSGALGRLKHTFKRKRPIFDEGESTDSPRSPSTDGHSSDDLDSGSSSTSGRVPLCEERSPGLSVSGDVSDSYPEERDIEPSPLGFDAAGTPPLDQGVLEETVPRRTRWNRGLLPKRFRQDSPVPAVPLCVIPAGASLNARHGERPALDTPVNSFGVFRRYFSRKFPSHDPEEYLSPSDLTNGLLPPDSPPPDMSTGPSEPERPPSPFPNITSYHLAQWFWLGGLQKTYKNFKELLGIIGHPSFQPQDVTSADWARIHRDLAGDDPLEADLRADSRYSSRNAHDGDDEADDENESWQDEPPAVDDSGRWRATR
ncbi:hypothetical protein OF83DRAFT_1179750, partial [Amylostereum chailletii]